MAILNRRERRVLKMLSAKRLKDPSMKEYQAETQALKERDLIKHIRGVFFSTSNLMYHFGYILTPAGTDYLREHNFEAWFLKALKWLFGIVGGIITGAIIGLLNSEKITTAVADWLKSLLPN